VLADSGDDEQERDAEYHQNIWIHPECFHLLLLPRCVVAANVTGRGSRYAARDGQTSRQGADPVSML